MSTPLFPLTLIGFILIVASPFIDIEFIVFGFSFRIEHVFRDLGIAFFIAGLIDILSAKKTRDGIVDTVEITSNQLKQSISDSVKKETGILSDTLKRGFDATFTNMISLLSKFDFPGNLRNTIEKILNNPVIIKSITIDIHNIKNKKDSRGNDFYELVHTATIVYENLLHETDVKSPIRFSLEENIEGVRNEHFEEVRVDGKSLSDDDLKKQVISDTLNFEPEQKKECSFSIKSTFLSPGFHMPFTVSRICKKMTIQIRGLKAANLTVKKRIMGCAPAKVADKVDDTVEFSSPDDYCLLPHNGMNFYFYKP